MQANLTADSEQHPFLVKQINNVITEPSIEQTAKDVDYKLVPPNGGYGWWICLGAGLLNAFNNVFNSLFGMLFGPFLEAMNLNTSEISLIFNLSIVIVNLSGLLTGFLFKKYSVRQVSICGSILISLGLASSAFCTEYWQMLFAYSLMIGLGLGLTTPAAFLPVQSYFTTRKTRAVGISLTGSSVGQIVVPCAVSFCMGIYGYQWTVLIVAFMNLSGLVGGALFEPVEKHMKRVKLEESEKESIKSKKAENLQIQVQENLSCWEKLSKLMDLKLLKSPVFLSIAFGIGICRTITINCSMLLPFFLQNTIQLDIKTVALCLSIIAGADLVSRLTFPLITERLPFSCKAVYLGGIFLMCVFRAIIAESRSLSLILAACLFYGYSKAFQAVNENLSISEYCASRCPESLPGALGLLMIIKGICMITVGQFLGWLRDYTQSYSLCLHMQNVFILFVIVVWASEALCKYLRHSPKNSDDTNDASCNGP